MILAVVGTGTGVGKTHVAAALLRYLRAGGREVLGWKPMESGVAGALGDDEAALLAACGARAPTLRFAAALAPPQAARLQGLTIDRAALGAQLAELAARWPTLVVELAGGWFSPFDDELDNAQWLAELPGALRARLRLVLVAPDRLGVLHDVSAALRAAATLQLAPRVLALSAPERGDASTGGNATELASRPLTRPLPLVQLPRATPTQLAAGDAIARLAGFALAPGG
ncbi:MAG: dethiobiotin synthase [Kofleriaceae bacterium]